MSTPDRQTPSIEAGPVGRQALLEVLLVVAVFAIHAAATSVGSGNEPHYLGKAIHFWQPDVPPTNLFLESADTHGAFFFTFGWLSYFLSPNLLLWTLRAVSWLLLAWGWFRLSRAVLVKRWIAPVTAALFVFLQSRYDLSGEWVVGGVEAKTFAYVAVLFGLEALVRGRWNRVWIWFGAASMFHVLVGGWAVVAAAIAWILRGRADQSLGAMLPGLLVGASLAMVGLVPALAMTVGVDSDIVQLANRIYFFERLGGHLDPWRFPPTAVLGFTLMVLFWVTLSATKGRGSQRGVAGVERSEPPESETLGARVARPQPPDPPLQQPVSVTDVSENRRLRAFVNGSIALLIAGLAIRLLTQHDADLTARLMRYYWFRLPDMAVPMGISLLATDRLLRLSNRKERSTGNFLTAMIQIGATVLAAILCAGLLRLLVERITGVAFPKEITLGYALLLHWWFGLYLGRAKGGPNRDNTLWGVAVLIVCIAPVLHLADRTTDWAIPPRLRAGDQWEKELAWREACHWADVNTAPDAVFLTPRMSSTFMWYARRSEVGTEKDIPQDAASMVGWWRQTLDVYALPSHQQWYPSLAAAFAERDDRTNARICRKYDVDYLVTIPEPALDLPKVFENGQFVIYACDEFGR